MRRFRLYVVQTFRSALKRTFWSAMESRPKGLHYISLPGAGLTFDCAQVTPSKVEG